MPEEKMVSEWALEWLEKQMQRGLSLKTKGSYRQWICQRVVPEFSDVALNELIEKHVQSFYESLAHEGLSQNSIWCGHMILRRLLDEAGREGLLKINPASEFKLRQRELIALKWSDLDSKRRILTIHMDRVVERRELVSYGAQTREIVLPAYTVTELEKEHEKHPSSEVMFIHPGTLKPYSPAMLRST